MFTQINAVHFASDSDEDCWKNENQILTVKQKKSFYI